MKWLPLLLGLSGCVGMTTLNGARTLSAGQQTLTVGGSNQVFSAQLRVGLAPDLDVGFTQRNQTFGVDLRHRFLRTEWLHIAAAPGIAVVPGGLGPGGEFGLQAYGFVELTLPLLVEAELSRSFSVVLAPRVTLSNRFVFNDANGSFYQEDVQWTSMVAAMGTRIQWHPRKRAIVGLSVDLQTAPTAVVGLLVLAGLDVTIPLDSARATARRGLRRQIRGRTP